MKIESDPKKRATGKTVLVVGDNGVIRKLLAAAFLSDGFKTCGKEAIEVAKQLKPDVITLDLSMPVMNGLTAASELRRVFPKTPIILLRQSVENGSFWGRKSCPAQKPCVFPRS